MSTLLIIADGATARGRPESRKVGTDAGDLPSSHVDPLRLVVSRLDRPRRSGDGYTARCPSHDDREPSLSVGPGTTRAVVVRCFRECPPEAILGALGFADDEVRAILAADRDGRVSTGAGPHRARRSGAAGLTVAELARAKGLPEKELRELGLRDAIGRRTVEIPYPDATGRVLFVRTRTPSKTLQPSGIPLTPYGLDRLDDWRASTAPIMVEGESDRWTALHHGRAALGLPGASSAGSLRLDHVADVERIYVLQEPDAGGPTFYTGVRKHLTELGWDGEVYAFGLTLNGRRIKDLSDLHLAVGGDRAAFAEALDAAIAEAVLVDLDADQPLIWADDDPSTWPAAARARITEFEELVAGQDGAATCDGNCPTSRALRDQLHEHKLADQIRRGKAFSAGETEVLRYYTRQASVAISRGKAEMPVWGEETERLTGQSPATATRLHKAYERFQNDPEIGPTLPWRLRWDFDAEGKKHYRVVVANLPDDPTERTTSGMLAKLAHLKRPGDRASHGGVRDACPKCQGPMTRTTYDICQNDACGHMVAHPSKTIGRAPFHDETPSETVEIDGAFYAVEVQAPSPFHDETNRERTYNEQDETVPEAPRELIPAPTLAHDEYELAASPRRYWVEAPPEEPSPPPGPKPLPVAPRSHVARGLLRLKSPATISRREA